MRVLECVKKYIPMEHETSQPIDTTFSKPEAAKSYILYQARIMQMVMERLGITDEEFVDRFAITLSNELRTNPGFTEAVLANDPAKDEEVIAAILGSEQLAA